MSPHPVNSFRKRLFSKNCKKPVHRRSLGMPKIAKRLRFVFYLLATLELVLVSVAWGRLPLR